MSFVKALIIEYIRVQVTVTSACTTPTSVHGARQGARQLLGEKIRIKLEFEPRTFWLSARHSYHWATWFLYMWENLCYILRTEFSLQQWLDSSVCSNAVMVWMVVGSYITSVHDFHIKLYIHTVRAIHHKRVRKDETETDQACKTTVCAWAFWLPHSTHTCPVCPFPNNICSVIDNTAYCISVNWIGSPLLADLEWLKRKQQANFTEELPL